MSVSPAMFVLPPIVGALCLFAFMQPKIRSWVSPYFPYLIVSTVLVTRICLYVVIYVLIGYKGEHGDIQLPGGWVYQATRIMQGQLPYRDFFSNYGILFSYLITVPYLIWRDPSSCVFLFILFDLGSLLLVWAIAKLRYGVETARDAVLLYAVSPLSWWLAVRYAQDEAIFCFLALLATYLWTRKNHTAAAFTLGLGFCVTKFLFGFVVLPFLLVSHRKLKHVTIVGAVIAVVHLPFVLSGVNVFAPFLNQSGNVTGLPIWQAVSVLFYRSVPETALSQVAGAATLAGMAWSCFVIWRRRLWPGYGILVVLLITLALSPKSYPLYALSYAGALAIYVADRKGVGLYCVFSAFFAIAMQFLPPSFVLRGGISDAQMAAVAVLSAIASCSQLYLAHRVLRGAKGAEVGENQKPIPSDAARVSP